MARDQAEVPVTDMAPEGGTASEPSKILSQTRPGSEIVRLVGKGC